MRGRRPVGRHAPRHRTSVTIETLAFSGQRGICVLEGIAARAARIGGSLARRPSGSFYRINGHAIVVCHEGKGKSSSRDGGSSRDRGSSVGVGRCQAGSASSRAVPATVAARLTRLGGGKRKERVDSWVPAEATGVWQVAGHWQASRQARARARARAKASASVLMPVPRDDEVPEVGWWLRDRSIQTRQGQCSTKLSISTHTHTHTHAPASAQTQPSREPR